MDETFLININCSSILVDFQETHYTMFIDTTKISIVYELVEWIRWVFSVKTCIYVMHENSVIHELEDIRVLSKLKNLEIKPCGRPHCVHKNAYRALLNNLDLFVNWNEMKVPKFFLEKLSQVDEKLVEKIRTNNHLKITETKLSHSFTENEHDRNSNERISLEKSCCSNLSSSDVHNNPLYLKKVLIDDSKSKLASVDNTSLEMNSSDEKRNRKEDLLIHFKDSSDCSNNSNAGSRNMAVNIKNCGNFSPVKSPVKNKWEIKDHASKNFNKSNFKKTSCKFVRPFSIGEILSNIREDLEKQKDALKNNTPSHIFTEEGNFDEAVTSEGFHLTKNFGKKRQRTRKRKKSKKQDAENEALIFPILETKFTQNFDVLKSNSNLKPSHIRFDAEEEENLMETDFVEDEIEIKNVNEFEVDQKIDDSDTTFVKAEAVTLTNDCQNFSNQPVVIPSECQNFSNQPVVIPSESKIEELAIGGEDKLIDLDGQVNNNNFQAHNLDGSCESDSFGQELNMFQSLKEKLKNRIVINRFY